MAKKDIDKENDLQAAEAEAEKEADANAEDIAATDEEQVDAEEAQDLTGDEAAMPAEVAAINTDNEIAQEANRGEEQAKKASSVKKRKRSKRYLEVAKLVESGKTYSLDQAVELVKKTANTKFDGSVEMHVKLVEKKGKKKTNEEIGRGIFHLPHGLGKNLKVVILNEEMIDQIAKTKKADFDVAIATPALMPKMGKVAKILGPKGKMPNPKFGTVTDNPEKAKEEIEKGRVEYRADATGVIHQMIGKVTWDDEKLKDNFTAVLQIFARKNIQSVALSSTMGPGIRVEL